MLRRLLFCLICLVGTCLATPAFAEKITAFDVHATLTSDRMLTVTETIKYDFEDATRHGIFRDIPVVYERNGGKYKLRVKIVDVTRNGKPEPWKLDSTGSNSSYRIGDPDAYVEGVQTYAITYKTNRAINSFADHDELYWNVSGNLWQAPRSNITFTFDGPVSSTNALCYTGVYGSTQQDCTITGKNTAHLIIKAKKTLTSGEDLTAVIALPPGSVQPLSIWDKARILLEDNWQLMMPFVVFILMFLMWFIRGRDPMGGAMIAQYEEPRKLRPAEMVGLIEQHIPQRAVSATIIDLARRGYFKLIYTGDPNNTGWFKDKVTFTFKRGKENDKELNTYEEEVLNHIFGSSYTANQEVALKDIKGFYKAVESIRSESFKTLKDKGFFGKDPTLVRASWSGLSVLVFILGFFGAGVAGPYFIVGCFFSAAIISIFGWLMPRTTMQGAVAREEVKGFKWFLSMTEEQRLKFHNAPEKRPELFERYLPAAVAFGVETQWAEQFKDINMEQPDYIRGNGTWNSLAYGHLASNFNTNASSNIYPAPSSSGSGSSGFSGGGSGGGFGGGGGGSW